MEVTYRMPSQGLGTDFSQFDRPINFASTYTNRFRNITGGAERRPGMSMSTSAAVPSGPNLTRLHEFVDQLGNETLMTSDDLGNIWANSDNLEQYTNLVILTASPEWTGDVDAGIDARPQSTLARALPPLLAGGTSTTVTSYYIGGYVNPGASCSFAINTYDVTGTAPSLTQSAVSATFSASSQNDHSWVLDPTGRYIAMYLQDGAAPTHRFVIFDTHTQAFGTILAINMGSSSVTKQIAWLDSTHLVIDHVSGGVRGVEVLSVAGTVLADLGFTGVWGAASSTTRVPLSYAQYLPLSSGGLVNYMVDVSGLSFTTIYAVSLTWSAGVSVGSPYTLVSGLSPGSGSGPSANFVATSATEYTLCYSTAIDYDLMSFTPDAASALITRAWQNFVPSFGTGGTTMPIYYSEDNILTLAQRGTFDNIYRLSDIALNASSFTLSTDATAVSNVTALSGYFMAARVERNRLILGSVGGFSSDMGQLGLIKRSTNVDWLAVLTGKAAKRLISAEADNKLIFVNGTDRNFYTDDAGNTFKELKALITQGSLSSSSSATAVVDGNVSNWISTTLVSNNDIVYNSTLNAYGLVTAVASAKLTITAIGSAGLGAGFVSRDQGGGDSYQLIDYVALNVIPDGSGGFTDVGTATAGTTTSVVAVSGVNFASTEIREDDFIYNSTRGGISHVGSVSANVNIKESMTGQVSGDALVFFKSAMPISSWIHVHYGRCYYLDSRNNQRVVISAPDDPQDVTTFQQTLDSTSFRFGTQQPSADVILSMNSFLSYFVASGKKNLYIYQGNTPIQDTSQTTIAFTPIAFYPNGLAGRFGLGTNGGDLLHITVDGLQAISIGYNSFSLNQNNASVPILNTLKNAIASQTNADNIQLTYYPRRRWSISKIGDQCFILNTQPSYDTTGQQQQTPSWHLFTGSWAQQNHYFVRRNGDLLACGSNGMVYTMDASAATDAGSPIATDLQTAWLRLEEPQITRRIKEGFFIEPVFESSPSISYTISVRAGLDNLSSDSIAVSAGGTNGIGTYVIGSAAIGSGSFAQANKYPLRWRGEEFRLGFSTESSATPDIITGFTVMGNIGGRR